MIQLDHDEPCQCVVTPDSEPLAEEMADDSKTKSPDPVNEDNGDSVNSDILERKQTTVDHVDAFCISNCPYLTSKKRITRCGLCMRKFHWICVGEDAKAFSSGWKCTDCLQFPQKLNGFHSDLLQQIKDMQTNLTKALAVNANLVNLYTAKVSECDLLKCEIEKLKDVIVKQSNGDIAIPSIFGGEQRSYSDALKSEPIKSLLIGDSLLKNVTQNESDKNISIVCKPGAKIACITKHLLDNKNKYNSIYVIISTNDIHADVNASNIINGYKQLISAATEQAKHVIVSSLPPHLDLPIELQLLLDTVNANLMELCRSEDSKFVNNDLIVGLWHVIGETPYKRQTIKC